MSSDSLALPKPPAKASAEPPAASAPQTAATTAEPEATDPSLSRGEHDASRQLSLTSHAPPDTVRSQPTISERSSSIVGRR